MSELDRLLADIESGKARRRARHDWNPQRQGRIDIRIAADGSWYHEGRRFQRPALVKLFAKVLRRENEAYYLVTPAEKLHIEVDDAPFVAALVETVEDDGRQAIVFTTNIGERVVLDRKHGLRIVTNEETGQPRPYLQLGDGLEALISRSAFYDLIGLAETRERDGRSVLVVSSLGHEFELGSIDE